MNVFITQFYINNNIIVLQHNNSLYLFCIFHACEKIYRYNKLYSSYKYLDSRQVPGIQLYLIIFFYVL